MTTSPMTICARILSLAMLLVTACTAQANTPKPSASKPALKPEDRARATLEAQVKAFPENNTALRATFAKDAVVLLPYGGNTIDSPSLHLGPAIVGLHPHTEMKGAKIRQFTAGGNASMAWLAAELAITMWHGEPGETPYTDTRSVHVVELLDAGSDWKVVAAAFSEVRPIAQRQVPLFGPVPAPTAAGPLAPLFASPEKLAAIVGADPVALFGTDQVERAFSASAAKALLNKWRKLPLSIEEGDKVREVHTANWAYAMAHVNIAKAGDAPYRMSAFLIAIPAEGGAWSVVAVNYGAL